MDLATAKARLRAIEPELAERAITPFHTFVREDRRLTVFVSERLRKAARKEGIWGAPSMLTTLKNASYGFDEQVVRSVGGRDGVFLLDRSFRPRNLMMAKLFDRFLDKPGGDAEEIASELGVRLGELLPVRLVSHRLRLLGVLARGQEEDRLVLVDCDRS